MLTFIILIILLYSFYVGYRKGLVLQMVKVASFSLTTLFASSFAQKLTPYIEMIIPFPSVQRTSDLALYNQQASFQVDEAFYRAISFVLVFFIGWLLTQFILAALRPLSYFEGFHYVNRLGGGVVNLLITFTFIFVGLFILSLIPVEWIQQQFVNNPVAFRIVSSTPILSEWAQQAWFQFNPFN